MAATVVDSKAILSNLSLVCRNALSSALSRCVQEHHYEVTVEHFVLSLLTDGDSDFASMVHHYDVDVNVLRRQLSSSLGQLRNGNVAKPTFSPLLLNMFQDAWACGSMECGFTKIRSGVIFYLLNNHAGKYAESYLSAPQEDVKVNLRNVIASSKEQVGDAGKAAEDSSAGAANHSVDPNSALGKYCIDYTGRARAGQIDPIFCREREVRQIIDILARRRKNNPIIVGDSGVGKTALVEGLALMISKDEVPEILRGTAIMGLDLGLLQAGASVKGEFENRLKSVIAEVKASGRIILFIDEAHNIIGAGNSQGGSDAAGLLKPALARGDLRTIAATTWKEYKKYFEKDAALERRFQPVKVDEPNEKDAVIMLRGLRPRFEDAHGIIITDEAVTAAVRLSSRYISGRQLPDKAVDLLDTCAARVRISLQQKPAGIEDAEVTIAHITDELLALRRDTDEGITVDDDHIAELEAKLGTVREQLGKLEVSFSKEKDLVQKVEAARKRMVGTTGDERDTLRRQVVSALKVLGDSQGEVPLLRPDVDERVIAAVVADWTGIPVGKMVSDDVKNLLEMEDRLNRRVKGQYFGLDTLAKELRGARAGIKPQNTPQGVFLLVGPSGTGKTETALTIADLMFGGEKMMATINMSEFQEKHSVSRLVGSPPGYVGFGEGGMLTEAVRQRPYTVVLLDECEKADKDVLNLFYQVFDKGMLADGEGRVVDFKNTVVILTSNLATDIITKMALEAQAKDPGKALDQDEAFMKEVVAAIKPTLVGHFKPALLARMTIVPYLPISPEALGEITRLKLNAVIKRLLDNQRIEGSYSDEMVRYIASQCTQVDAGARNIDHILRATLLPQLSVAILEKIASTGLPKRVRLDINDSNEFTIQFSD